MKNNAIMTIELALKEKAPFAHPLVHSPIAFKSLPLSEVHFEVQSAIALALLARSWKSLLATLRRKYFTILVTLQK